MRSDVYYYIFIVWVVLSVWFSIQTLYETEKQADLLERCVEGKISEITINGRDYTCSLEEL